MASQGRERARSSRRASKKRRDSEKEPRRLSLDVPERFKDGDDADDDVTAPRKNNTMSMNQSIFSMIARAGQQSQTDLATMQEVDSGDSDNEGKRRQPYHSLDGASRLSRLSSANDSPRQTEKPKDGESSRGKQHRRVLSEHKLLRSLPKLKGKRMLAQRTSLKIRCHPRNCCLYARHQPSLPLWARVNRRRRPDLLRPGMKMYRQASQEA